MVPILQCGFVLSNLASLTENIEHITEYTVKWFLHLKEKYGAKYPRRTTLRGFDSIQATKVAEANKRFYFDKKGGFIGTALKDNEFLFNCSDLDDILIIYNTGVYKIVRVQEKLFVGPDNRVIVQITIDDAEKADEAFTILMGDQVVILII